MKKPVWIIFITLILFTGCSTNTTNEDVTISSDYTITEIQCGAAETSTSNRLTLFDSQTNRLYGWNHIINGAKEFDGLQLAAADYKVSAANGQIDPACANNNVFQVILVKKYADWDRQHLNGIEPQFLYEGITFGQVRHSCILNAVIAILRFRCAAILLAAGWLWLPGTSLSATFGPGQSPSGWARSNGTDSKLESVCCRMNLTCNFI